MATFALSMTAAIFCRLIYLQLILYRYYEQKSRRNYTRFEHMPATRGEILDVNGIRIATNRPHPALYWQGTGQRKLNEKQHSLLTNLTQDITDFVCTQKMLTAITRAERTNELLLLYRASAEKGMAISLIEERYGTNPNLRIIYKPERYYPYGKTACHIIGYLQKNGQTSIGRMGLEKKLDQMLSGNTGIYIKTINCYGKKISRYQSLPNIDGTAIKTTLDLHIQQIAERVFCEPHTGSLIIMDPFDGSIKALVSLPGFDPNIFAEPLDAITWQKMQDKRPFLNKATLCSYAPGSLFKLISAAAALEEKIIAPDEHFCCNGSFAFYERNYHCNRSRGHGKLLFSQAIAHSCNIPFYEIGTKLSIDTLADYAHRFGLGEPTGFLLGEKEGLIPTTVWKRKTKGENWWPGETLSALIGQSYLSVTPLQIACMIGAIFTGQLVRPRILSDTPMSTRPLDLLPETRNFLQNAMRSAVTQGTARDLSSLCNMTLYAKTGTAQVAALQKTNNLSTHKAHGWAAIYVAKKDELPFVMVVLVEHAGSSRVATNIAKAFLTCYAAERRT